MRKSLMSDDYGKLVEMLGQADQRVSVRNEMFVSAGMLEICVCRLSQRDCLPIELVGEVDNFLVFSLGRRSGKQTEAENR